jgi:preprotein translocase subunit SecG
MMTVFLVVHAVACIGLITIILIQRGRGGGLVDSFSGLDSVFGTKTAAFLTKMTSVFAVVFFCTCLALAFLSVKQSRSLLSGTRAKVRAKAAPLMNVTAPAEPQAVSNATAAPQAVQTPVAPAVQAQAGNQTKAEPLVKYPPEPKSGELK